MKKMYIILFIISLLILCGCNYIDNKEERIRIIANSNSEKDLEDKKKIRDALLEIFYTENITNIEKDIYVINNLLKQKELKLNNSFVIEYKNVAFPAKVLNGKLIPSGTYKTLLITIGSGQGNNWWSVLYPEFFGINYEDSDEIEYKSFIYEILNSN